MDGMKTSTLFLNYVTCIDYAVIDEKGIIRGGSFTPIIEVTGNIDPQEKVVVDFSRIKKDIKALIDDKETGFDHKLWCVSGFSNAQVKSASEGGLEIIAENTQLIVPKNAVKVFETTVFVKDIVFTYEREITNYLNRQLNIIYPGADISVFVKLTSYTLAPTWLSWNFNYTHGLKDSTSWGCQNIAHGHYSYVDFIADPGRKFLIAEDSLELCNMVSEMDNAVFVNRANIVYEDYKSLIIEYTTPRGLFKARYVKEAYNIIILETETTVEYIVDWFVKRNEAVLKRAGICKVYLSEGLSKGATVKIC